MEPLIVMGLLLGSTFVWKVASRERDTQPMMGVDLPGSTIRVISNIATATVYIDGVAKGPPGQYAVQPGSHVVKVESTGYIAWEKTVSVRDTENTTVNADLNPVAGSAGGLPVLALITPSIFKKASGNTVPPTRLVIVYEPRSYFRRTIVAGAERTAARPFNLRASRMWTAGQGIERDQNIHITRDIVVLGVLGVPNGRVSAERFATFTDGEKNAYRERTAQLAVLDASAQGQSPIDASQVIVSGGRSDSTAFVMSGSTVTIFNDIVTGGIDDDIGVQQFNSDQNTLVITEPPPGDIPEMRVNGPAGFVLTRVKTGSFASFTLLPGVGV